tara:strand:+ start:1819 stop:2070 length:252 start_codon:yes stop_codon:yes gene_type:complete
MSANLLYQLNKLQKQRAIRKKQEWLEKNLKYSENSSDENLKYKDVIAEYLCDVTMLLEKNNYRIRDKKQFKDDITSYIYNESN